MNLQPQPTLARKLENSSIIVCKRKLCGKCSLHGSKHLRSINKQRRYSRNSRIKPSKLPPHSVNSWGLSWSHNFRRTCRAISKLVNDWTWKKSFPLLPVITGTIGFGWDVPSQPNETTRSWLQSMTPCQWKRTIWASSRLKHLLPYKKLFKDSRLEK